MNTPPILTFFNNKGGVGKTSLVYHLAWMFAELGQRVIAFDLDPQVNLTAAFLDDEKIERIWEDHSCQNSTIYQCVKPLLEVGDIKEPKLQTIKHDSLYLMPGDLGLSNFEDELSNVWPDSMKDNNLYRPMRILSSFWQCIQMAASQKNADIILVDIGPNLGAINRSVLISTNYVLIPLGADLFSLLGLKNLGPMLKKWRSLWEKRINNWKSTGEAQSKPDFTLPTGQMQPIGYLCQQYGVRLDRPVKAYEQWVNRIPKVYRKYVLGEKNVDNKLENLTPADDPYCLATVKHYRSLIPLAQESRKPIFNLTSADGAIGGHANAAKDAGKDFKQLALKIAKTINLEIL